MKGYKHKLDFASTPGTRRSRRSVKHRAQHIPKGATGDDCAFMCPTDAFGTTAEPRKPRTKFLDYDARREPKTDFWCVMCQRDLDRRDPKLRWIHLIEDVFVLHPEDASRYTPDAKDRGAFPIGPECARKLGSEWTHPSEAAARGATP